MKSFVSILPPGHAAVAELQASKELVETLIAVSENDTHGFMTIDLRDALRMMNLLPELPELPKEEDEDDDEGWLTEE